MRKGTKIFQKIKEQKFKKKRIPTKTAKQKNAKKQKAEICNKQKKRHNRQKKI